MTARRTPRSPSARRATPAPPGVIFTDLDGTLLDHPSYDFGPAAASLSAAREAGVPVVLCSSKTRAEMAEWQSRLGLADPYISENGGAVFVPDRSHALVRYFPERWEGVPAKVFGTPYALLRPVLEQLRSDFTLPVRGFGDMTTGEVEALTGLSGEDAERACWRDFDEPFVWAEAPDEDRLEAVRSWLSDRRLQVFRGGRLWHLVGGNDKGAAVRWLLDVYQDVFGHWLPSLGLGDSENDLPMLHVVDRGGLVERRGGGHLEGAHPNIVRFAGEGPVGWARAVGDWLAMLGAGTRVECKHRRRVRA